jgi:plasmid maintenance system killer protein
MKNILYLLILITCLACQTKEKPTEVVATTQTENPAAEGFNLEASDQSAIDIADQVMAAMGGRKAWNDTRYISWQFFNSRKLWWDKWTGDVRVESLNSDLKILVNINDLTGKVYRDSAEYTNVDSLDYFLGRGKSMWINDAYWLVMPYKLKDSGVTLKQLKEDTTAVGELSEVLQLSFESVGDTPENIYKVWIDKKSSLVTQWAFYRNDTVTVPNFITPWDDYNKYGNILLSGGRGRGKLSEINVMDSMSVDLFTEF